jgi:DNA mismatch repair protein MutS
MPPTSTPTPAMRQYLEAKRQYPDAIVFFRMGDFYEMFYEDALVASRALDLTLTSRSKDATGSGIPMCGVPFHAADGYLARLVGKGHRVAVCEQVEDPRKAKGLVKREVVRVVSPGTLTDSSYLEAREPAFLMAIVPGPAPKRIATGGGAAGGDELSLGAAVLDVSTGEFSTAEYRGRLGQQSLADDLTVLAPKEIVVPSGWDVSTAVPDVVRLQLPITEAEPWRFEGEAARRTLLDQFHSHGLEGYGIEHHDLAVRAAGGLLAHLRDTQKVDLLHVHAVTLRTSAAHLIIDPTTLEHLEVVAGRDGGRRGSLLGELDHTVTAMAGRLLRAWLLRPLVALEPIQDRLDAVEALAFRATDRGKLREALTSVHDLERLVARVVLGSAAPRDLVALGHSLATVPRVAHILTEVQAPLIGSLVAALDPLADVRDRIEATLVGEPPALTREGGFTRDGIDADLDDLKRTSRGGRAVIAEMEDRERERTGIASLKVRFNRVFGYYIEVSKANLHLVPEDYLRKQTVANGERFTTIPLKEHEAKVLGADEHILTRELEIFEALRAAVAAEAVRIQATARALATLDVLAGLAEVASICNYTKPHVHEGEEMLLTDTRHPVVERHVSDAFVPNDIDLNATTRQLMVLTGPNMGGKSTYLRQAALLPILAQVGSFVPARDAKLPIVDRIFARVGASDNIARGQSTFMVEMQETAYILNSATSRSLVVLDEIGRGTATFDGLSLAWAVAEYLATHTSVRPKTLFATHYHELTDLADLVPGVVNAHVSAREWKDDIVFLRKIVPGRSDRSYGIQVARLAGLPRSVVVRAHEILKGLERDEVSRGGRPTLSRVPGESRSPQLGLFAAPATSGHAVAEDTRARARRALIERLAAVNADTLTPIEALTLLGELARTARDTDD